MSRTAHKVLLVLLFHQITHASGFLPVIQIQVVLGFVARFLGYIWGVHTKLNGIDNV
jgi:hypothetical protein